MATETCDVTVLPLRVAKYYINSKFPDSLLITGELFDSIPIGAAFAVLPKQHMLRDILDRVIAVIPPDELEDSPIAGESVPSRRPSPGKSWYVNLAASLP